MIQTLSSDTPQKAFTDRIGSRRVIRCFENLDAACCCDTSETGSKLAIIITNEIRGSLSIWSRLSQLLCRPRVGRRPRHADMDDLPRIQFNDEEGKERTEQEISDVQEIAGPDLSPMIVQKRPPALPHWARRTPTPRVLLDRSFTDTDIEFQ